LEGLVHIWPVKSVPARKHAMHRNKMVLAEAGFPLIFLISLRGTCIKEDYVMPKDEFPL